MSTSSYTHDFYGDQAPGSARSAGVVLPVVFELLQPRSLIDVGCGVGTWARAATDLGVEQVVGVDGEYAIGAGLQIPAEAFVAADLANGFPSLTQRFDLAMSLEVAEHLPAARSSSFVADLCGLADVVLFSAAVPGQLGTDHITLESQSTWAERFRVHGYEAFDLVRPRIWNDERVEAFYRQNAIVYVRSERADLIIRARSLAADLPTMVDIVHPELLAFWVRRATRRPSTAQAVRQVGTSLAEAVRRRMGRRG